MSLFYYINLVKHKNFDSPKLLECLIIWNGGSTKHEYLCIHSILQLAIVFSDS